jgi:carboxymethylenebutenolidase
MAGTGSMIDAGGVPAYLARPDDQGRFSAILICFEAFGLNNHIKEVCERLAREGYVAIAPDFYHRQPEPRTSSYSDMEYTFKLAGTLIDTDAMNDARRAIDYLKAQPFVDTERIGVMGFCMGGRLAFLTACRFPADIKAAVPFYGGGIGSKGRFEGQTTIPLDEADQIKAPLLLFFGERDAYISPQDVQRIESQLQALNKNAEVLVYPEVDHGFFCDERASYNAEAARNAWGRALSLFENAL